MEEEIAKPNFFIIGPPRSGTTFMQKYLGNHPEVFMAPGEPSFFCSDYVEPWLSRQEYLDLFEGTEDFEIRAEKTVFYLPSEVAPQKIKEFNPEAKLLVIARNPVEAAYSLHFKQVSIGRESIWGFEQAWKAQSREDGSYQGNLKVKSLRYGEIYQFGKHLKRFYQVFPREQIEVVVFDDLIEDEKQVYRQALDFLNLPSVPVEDFSEVNPNCRPKSKIFNRLFRFRGLIPAQRIKKLLGIEEQIGLVSKLRSLNQEQAERDSLSPDFKNELADYFQPDVELLSELLNRDLTHWVNL